MKLERESRTAVCRLLFGYIDVQPDGLSACFQRSLIRGFHHARAAAGDDGESLDGQSPRQLCSGLIVE
jgi:hypothetical protein